jgi:hypothetical protein
LKPLQTALGQAGVVREETARRTTVRTDRFSSLMPEEAGKLF